MAQHQSLLKEKRLQRERVDTLTLWPQANVVTAPKLHSYQERSFKGRFPGWRFVVRTLKGRELLVRQAGLEAHLDKQRAQLDPAC